MDLSPPILSSISKEVVKEITVAPLVETRATAIETTTEAVAAKITVETTTVTTVAEVATSATTAIEITMIVVLAVLATRAGSLSSAPTISETAAE